MATTDQAVLTESVETDHENECPECHGTVETEGTERVCQSCGLVVLENEYNHDHKAWGRYGRPDERDPDGKRTNRDLVDRGLGSRMGFPGERDAATASLATWNDRFQQSKTDRNRAYATLEIQRIAAALEWGDDLRTQAKTLFRQAHDAGEAVGRDLDTLAAACVYTVARVHQRGLTPNDVARYGKGVDPDELVRRHKVVCETAGVPTPPPDPRQRIRVVAADAGVSHTVADALDVLERCDDAVIHSRSPSSVAAAILWRVSEVTQERVGEAADVSPTGLRKCWYEHLEPSMDGTESVTVPAGAD